MAAVGVVDEERHLAEALLGEVLGRLVLALAQGDVDVLERLAGERQHEPDLVRRARGEDAVEGVARGHG